MKNDTRLALRDVAGPLHDLNQKLAGRDGHRWLRALNKTLRHENPWRMARDFSTWRRVEIPKVGAAELLLMLNRDGYILEHQRKWFESFDFPWAAEKWFAEFALVSPAELGFSDVKIGDVGFCRYNEFIQEAKLLGFGLCSPKEGMVLRLEYGAQPSGERIYVAMAPMGKDKEIFEINHLSAGQTAARVARKALEFRGIGGDIPVTWNFVFARSYTVE